MSNNGANLVTGYVPITNHLFRRQIELSPPCRVIGFHRGFRKIWITFVNSSISRDRFNVDSAQERRQAVVLKTLDCLSDQNLDLFFTQKSRSGFLEIPLWFLGWKFHSGFLDREVRRDSELGLGCVVSRAVTHDELRLRR